MPDKFDSELARHLYEKVEPNDQVGSSSEGSGWAGLYVSSSDGGSIVLEQVDGSVELFTYSTEAELRDAWNNFERTLEIRIPRLYEDVIIVLGGDLAIWVSPSPEDHEDGPAFVAEKFVSFIEAVVELKERGFLVEDEVWKWEEGAWYLMEI